MSNSLMIVLAAGVAPLSITAVIATVAQAPVIAAATGIGVAMFGAFVGVSRRSRVDAFAPVTNASNSSNALMHNQSMDGAWNLS